MHETASSMPQGGDVCQATPRRLSWKLIGGLAFLCLLGLIALLGPVAVWDGHFKVNVSIHSRSAKPVQAVSCALSFHRDMAEWLSQSDNSEADYEFKALEDFDGKNGVAYGKCSGRRTCWGAELGYVAERFAALRIDLANGQQVKTIAEIPMVPGPRSITVEIP